MNVDKLEWLKRIDLKIVRGGYVLRELKNTIKNIIKLLF